MTAFLFSQVILCFMTAIHSLSRSIVGFAGAAMTMVVLPALGQSNLAPGKVPAVKERIGVYDSRCIAVAFAGSPMHERQLRELRAQHNQAKEAGDLDKVARLEAEGKARQHKAHQQAFSTAPVDDLLLHVTNKVTEIQKSAGLVAIISKWDEAGLKK